MKLPWVSRVAYELVLEQNRNLLKDRVSRDAYELALDLNRELREKNLAWEDHARRIERSEHGMTEVPREPRSPLRNEPQPQLLREYILSFGDSRTIKTNRAVADRRYQAGESWQEIMDDVIVPDEPRERIMGAEDPEEDGDEHDEGDAEADAGPASAEEQEPGRRESGAVRQDA